MSISARDVSKWTQAQLRAAIRTICPMGPFGNVVELAKAELIRRDGQTVTA